MLRVLFWILGWIGILFLVAVILVGNSSNWFGDKNNREDSQIVDMQTPEPVYITLDKFNNTEIGMSYNEVCDIIGSEGALMGISDFGVGEEHITEIYQWKAENNTFGSTMTFQGGKLVEKYQVGLG